MAKIGHSELIWTTLVGKYWKSCKTAKIGHSAKQPKFNLDHFSKKILEKLQDSQYIGKVAKQPKLAILN